MIRLFLCSWLFLLVLLGSCLDFIGRPSVRLEDDRVSTGTSASRAVELLGRAGRADTYDDLPQPWAVRTGRSRTCLTIGVDAARFADNSTAIDAATSRLLADFVAELRSAQCVSDARGNYCDPSEVHVAVYGHSDDLPAGRPGGNQQLSFERALAVASVLMGEGFAIHSVEGFGSTVPVVRPEADERSPAEIRRDNRRAEVGLWCPAER